jgi:hypothetical protein
MAEQREKIKHCALGRGVFLRFQFQLAKLERTYNESVATGQSDAPSRGLDFLDP